MTRIRSWEQREFFDPEPVLKALRALEAGLSDVEMPDRVQRLRTGRLRTEHEARAAALFAHGMATVVGEKVYVSPGETEDADCVTAVRVEDSILYTPVQLKELVPADLNANTTLSGLFQKLVHLPHSDTVLAVYLNRDGRVEFPTVEPDRFPFAELWYFGSSSPDAMRWFLIGDVLSNPVRYEFTYPV